MAKQADTMECSDCLVKGFQVRVNPAAFPYLKSMCRKCYEEYRARFVNC